MPKTKSLCSVHPSVLMTRDWVATLKNKSGRSLDEWLTLVKKSGPRTGKERREWLKQAHGLGTNSAWWIAQRAEGKSFAQIRPAARTRIDLGFALGGRPPEGRLISTGGFAKRDRITHRIPTASPAEIDDQGRRWLRVACDEDAG